MSLRGASAPKRSLGAPALTRIYLRALRTPGHRFELSTLVIFAFSTFNPVCFAAEIKNETDAPIGKSVYVSMSEKSDDSKKHPGYTDVLPGSRRHIRSSGADSYLKPKQLSSMRSHQPAQSNRGSSFKSAPSASHHAANQQTANSRVISSSPPSSRISVQPRMGRPAPSVTNSQPMSQTDYDFMDKLSETLKASDPQTSSRLADITAGQKQNRPLTKSEYDVLVGMSKQLGDNDASYRLQSIADKRRKEMY
jgi:hypothetical protein